MKRGPEGGNFGSFHKLYDNEKPVYMPMEIILNKKQVCDFIMWIRFLKSQS